ncbi:TPA: hypothetical protein ACGVAV_002575 [Vibrio vulnificus]
MKLTTKKLAVKAAGYIAIAAAYAPAANAANPILVKIGGTNEASQTSWIYNVTDQFKSAYANINTKTSDWVENADTDEYDAPYKATIGPGIDIRALYGYTAHAAGSSGPTLLPPHIAYTPADGANRTITESKRFRETLNVYDASGQLTDLKLGVTMLDTLWFEGWNITGEDRMSVQRTHYGSYEASGEGDTIPAGRDQWESVFAPVQGRWAVVGVPDDWTNVGEDDYYLNWTRDDVRTAFTFNANYLNVSGVVSLWLSDAALYAQTLENLPDSWSATLPLTVVYM